MLRENHAEKAFHSLTKILSHFPHFHTREKQFLTAKTQQVHSTVLIMNYLFIDKKKLTVEAANMKTPFSQF